MSDTQDKSDTIKRHPAPGLMEWQIRTDAAVKNERYRIVALILDEIARWKSHPTASGVYGTDHDYDEVIALKRLLRRVEDTSHE
jgi:hypothetical protein